MSKAGDDDLIQVDPFYLALAPNNPLPGLTLPITLAGTALFGWAFVLNRAGRYTLAAGLTIGITVFGVWAAVIADADHSARDEAPMGIVAGRIQQPATTIRKNCKSQK